MGEIERLAMNSDKVCKLLDASQPLVWAFAIVFGVLGVGFSLRYFITRRATTAKKDGPSDADVNVWR